MRQNEIKRQQIEMLSGIMGCMVLLFLGRILGNNGITYLGIAYLTVGVVQTLLSGGVADGVGRLLKVRNAKGQYRNVAVTQRRILMLQSVLGILASAAFAVLADVFAEKIFQMHYSTVMIRILALSLFFRVVSSGIIECFLGEQEEGIATLISPIRQILVLVFGLIFAGSLGDYGIKVSNLLGNESYGAMYAGVGVAVAISLTEALLFLFCCVTFMTKRRRYKGDKEEGMKQVDSLFITLRSFWGAVWMPMLLKLIPLFLLWLGMFLYRKNTADGMLFAEHFGMLCGTFLTLCGIPVLMICVVLQNRHLRKSRIAKNGYLKGMRMAVVSALFFTMYFAVMCGQLAGWQEGSQVLEKMFAHGSSLILLTVLFFYFSRLLLLFERRLLVLGVYGLGTIVFVIMATIWLKSGQAGVMAFLYAAIVSLVIGDILLGVLGCRLLHMRIDWLRTFAIPFGMVAAIGLLCILFSKFCTPHLGNFVTVLVSLLISGFLYWILYKKTSFY